MSVPDVAVYEVHLHKIFSYSPVSSFWRVCSSVVLVLPKMWGAQKDLRPRSAPPPSIQPTKSLKLTDACMHTADNRTDHTQTHNTVPDHTLMNAVNTVCMHQCVCSIHWQQFVFYTFKCSKAGDRHVFPCLQYSEAQFRVICIKLALFAHVHFSLVNTATCRTRPELQLWTFMSVHVNTSKYIISANWAT